MLMVQMLPAWSPESLLLSQAWYTVAMTIAMSLRMGALRRQRDRLQVLAERDPLTNLPNRRAMAATLPRRIDEAKAQGRSIAVVFVDSIASSPSTIRWATPWATRSSPRWHAGSPRCFAVAIWLRGTAARSSS
jgi:hypothetical protein